MFTFIKKVIKTGTATSSYPLERLRLIKTSVVSQSRTRSSASAAQPASMPARQTP